MAKQKFAKDAILDALRNAHGLKTGAAELLGLGSWNTIDKYCAKYKEAQEIVDHWKKRRKDRAEYKLDEAIERGESWAIMFTLKNAHDREYSDKLDVTSAGKALPDVIGVKLIDYRIGVTDAEAGPSADRQAPSQGQDTGDGAQMGQDPDGG